MIGCDHGDVHQRANLAAGISSQCNRLQPQRTRHLDGAQHIGRIAAGGNGNHQITRLRQCTQLLGEDGVVSHVVGVGRHQCHVVVERQRTYTRQPWLHRVLAQVAGQVCCGGGAATIAHKQHLPTLLPRFDDGLHYAMHLIPGHAVERALHCTCVFGVHSGCGGFKVACHRRCTIGTVRSLVFVCAVAIDGAVGCPVAVMDAISIQHPVGNCADLLVCSRKETHSPPPSCQISAASSTCARVV